MNAKYDGDKTTFPKETLRQQILTKIKLNGGEEMDTTPVKKTNLELTAEDIEKRERRKEQNRKAATKFRNKRKTHLEVKNQEREELIRKNKKLTCKVEELTKELIILQETHDRHLSSGCCAIVDQLNNSDLNQEASALNEDTSALKPDTACLNPNSTNFTDTTHLETCGLNTESPQFNTESTNGPLDDIDHLIPNINQFEVENAMGRFGNYTSPQESPQFIFDDVTGTQVDDFLGLCENSQNGANQLTHVDCIVANEFKIPETSQNSQVSTYLQPQHDQPLHLDDGSLDTEFDISMYQQPCHAQPQFSPFGVETEEDVESWVSENLEQYSLTNL